VLRVLLLAGKSHGRQRRRGTSKVLIDDWDASRRAASTRCCRHCRRSCWQQGRRIGEPAPGGVLLHLLGRGSGRLAWALVWLRGYLACGSGPPSLLLAAATCSQLLLLLRCVPGLLRLQHLLLLLRLLPRGRGPLLRHCMRCTDAGLPG
jgi:hypothetical protein